MVKIAFFVWGVFKQILLGLMGLCLGAIVMILLALPFVKDGHEVWQPFLWAILTAFLLGRALIMLIFEPYLDREEERLKSLL